MYWRPYNLIDVFNLIEKLRQKPEGAKKRIAFLASFSFSVLILGIWFSVIYPDFKFKEKQKQSAAAVESGPTESFFKNIKDGFSGAKEQIDIIKQSVSNIASSTKHIQNNSADIDVNYVQPPIASSTINSDFEAGI